MTASVGLRHLFCRRQDHCCGLQIPDDRKVPLAVPVMLTSRYLRRLNRSKNKWRTYRLSLRNHAAVSSIQQCAVSKKAPKELLTSIHSVVRHLRERLDAPMQWDTSSGFSSPENMRVTSEITTACVNEKYPASVVQRKLGDKIASKSKVLKCFEEFKALKLDDIKNICASMNPNVHPPAKKQCVGGGTANDVSSDEERDDDSGDLVGMFNDVSSVENEDIEDNSECNETRWTSTQEMIARYFKIKQRIEEIATGDGELTELLLSPAANFSLKACYDDVLSSMDCAIPLFGKPGKYELLQFIKPGLTAVVNEYQNLFITLPGTTLVASHQINTTGSLVCILARESQHISVMKWKNSSK
ncbi:hypothetical protein EMCRGX_G030196 [Ephydatia muelleri]